MKITLRKINSKERYFVLLWYYYSFFYFLIKASNLIYTYSNLNVSRLYGFVIYSTLLGQLLMVLSTNKWKYRRLLLCFAIVIITILMQLATSDASFIITIMFIVLADNVNIDKMLRYDIKFKVFILLLIIGLCSMGLLDNYSAVINGVYKQAYGFNHPNSLTTLIIVILVEWLCIRNKSIKMIEYILIAFIWYLAQKFGGGRSATITFAFIFFLYVLFKYLPHIFRFKAVKRLITLATPIMVFVSFLTVYLYSTGNTFIIWLNEILTGRIQQAALALFSYGLTPLGQDIAYISSRQAQVDHVTAMIVDNAYIHTALSNGVIFLVFIVAMYTLLMCKFVKNDRIDLALLSLFFAVLGFGETYIFNVSYSISFLYILTYEDKLNKYYKGFATTGYSIKY